MITGPIFVDGYSATQDAVALIGAVSVAIGAGLLVLLAVRAFLQRRWIAGLVATVTAFVVPPFSASAPIVGPYAEQWLDWFIYGSAYGFSPPRFPDLSWILYGVPLAHGFEWLSVGMGLIGAAMAGHALLPLRGPLLRIDSADG